MTESRPRPQWVNAGQYLAGEPAFRGSRGTALVFRITHASGTQVVEFDLVLEYGYLQFMGPREHDKGSMRAARHFQRLQAVDRSLKDL